jgi:hypothetical protein
MNRTFAVYAAIADEANEGWIWFNSDLPTRTIVKVTNDRTRRSVYCASRKIDEDFLNNYNDSEKRKKISRDGRDTLVMSAWYRDALGGFKTTARSCGQRIRLTITPSRFPLWGTIRAACHHPEIVARIGTRLGVLGAWLGLTALVPPILISSRDLKGDDPVIAWTQVIVAVMGGIVGWLACRGVKPPGRGANLRSAP